MDQRAEIGIWIYDSGGVRLLGSTKHPRKVTIKSGFGAMKRRCWLELYQEDQYLPIEIGSILKITVNRIDCFRGRIQERRIDSIDDPLSCYAEFDPEREYNKQIYGTFENQRVREILQHIVVDSGLSLTGVWNQNPRFHRLVFTGEPLFLAIDLLAKLAGNLLWDVRENGNLEMRPLFHPDHWLVLRRDADGVNLWQTVNDVFAVIEIAGGVKEGSVYEKTIEIPELSPIVEIEKIRVYIRPIADLDAFHALRRSTVQQMTLPHYEHYVDWLGEGEKIKPGETARFYAENLVLFPQTQLFRIKMREMTYLHETLQTRFHVTSGFESAETYFHYFHVDHPISQFGPFQLDVSALDSPAYLDSVPV